MMVSENVQVIYFKQLAGLDEEVKSFWLEIKSL